MEGMEGKTGFLVAVGFSKMKSVHFHFSFYYWN
jgi:hypothetical protein